MDADLSYFRRRASVERTAALHARDGRSRDRHLELAERYENIVRAMMASRPPSAPEIKPRALESANNS